jgi:hypothetical protein
MSPRTTSKVTVDHDEIRRWAESRGARPVAVRRTDSDDESGIIRLEFPRALRRNDSGVQEIGWDEWFKKFDANHLALLHQEETAAGERSDFNNIISRETAEEAALATGGKGRSATPKPAAKAAGVGARVRSTRSQEATKRFTLVRGKSAGPSRAGSRSRAAEKRTRSRSKGRPTASTPRGPAIAVREQTVD